MERGLVVLFLGLFALQVFLTRARHRPRTTRRRSSRRYVFLKTGQRHVLPEQPPLISVLSALPLLGAST